MRLVEACLFNAENLLVVPVVSTVVNTVRFVEFRNGGARTSKVQKDVLSQGHLNGIASMEAKRKG